MNTKLAFLLIINAASFLFMLVDKENAKENLPRIPERLLLAMAIIGGSIGSFLGMHIFHHKTRHARFKFGLPIILGVHILLAVLIMCLKMR